MIANMKIYKTGKAIREKTELSKEKLVESP